MDGKRTYVDELDLAVGGYHDAPGADRFLQVLCRLFEGIAEDRALPCPIETDLEDMTARPMFLRKNSGKTHLVLLTELDGEEYPRITDLRLRAVMRLLFSREDCEGIVFNPSGKRRFYIPKQFLAQALSAGYSMAVEDMENEKENETRFSEDNSIAIRRPIGQSVFEAIEDRIRGLTEDEDDYVIVDLIEDRDDLRCVQTKRHGALWYVELVYDMSDFDWEYPLILGAEMSLEEAVELFQLICAHGVSPDDIPMVQERFRDIGFRGPEDEDE